MCADDRAALLRADLLQFAVHLLALGRIGLTASLDQELVETLVLPGGLVPLGIRCIGQRHHDVGRRAHVPGRHVQRILQPNRAPVTVVRHLLDVQVETNLGTLALQQQADIG